MSKFATLTRTLNRAGLKIKKHSPEILLVTGVVGAVASAVLACKATTKLSEVLAESKENVEQIHNYVEENGYSEKYTEQDNKKDLAIVYAKTGMNLVKLYGPAVLLGAASITCILSSHKIIKTRSAAIAAAYTAVDTSFKDYRKRVIERFGKELDKELKYDLKAKEIEETVVNEDGTETTVKKKVTAVDPNMRSQYSKFFDEYCNGWDKDPEYNLMFLRHQQNQANDILKAKGHLFLNEVYDMLGIARTKAGQVVGWIYDENNELGDNYVDFGIYDLYNEGARDFVNGRERSILLDFNVDGNIWELMK